MHILFNRHAVSKRLYLRVIKGEVGETEQGAC